jgi:hypothetical protein
MHAHRGTFAGWRPGRTRPDPWRSAAPFVALALCSLVLEATGAWRVGIAAAGFFSAAAVVAGWTDHQALDRLRASADKTLLRSPRHQFSVLLTWRSGEILDPTFREGVARELRRAVHAARPGSLPGPSPVDRAGTNRHALELAAIAHRLESPDPVDVRGVLLARTLVRGQAPLLYGKTDPDELDRVVRHVESLLGVSPPGVSSIGAA